jgi:anti-sigma factor RsiW
MTEGKSIEDLIQQGIDNELTPEERQELDAYLKAHPEEAERYQSLSHQSDLIKGSVPVPSPEHLAQLKANATRPRRINSMPRIAASLAIFAVGIALGLSLPRQDKGFNGDLGIFAQQAHAAHSLYVSEVLHPVEVVAAERDHLQTWLSNRLGAAIIAPKLGETGFSLIGGRLLPAGDKASALFMYENAQGNRISLLATHGTKDQSQSFRFHETGGYLTIFWQDGPWRYSLVGDIPREPMDEIARAIHGQLL